MESLFENISPLTTADTIKYTRHAIEYVRNHPSLPVSFDVKKGVQQLHDYLQKAESFSLLQSLDSEVYSESEWKKFSSTTFSEILLAMSRRGSVKEVCVIVERHYHDLHKELLSGVASEHLVSIPKDSSVCSTDASIVEVFFRPIPTNLSLLNERSLINLIQTSVLPNLVEVTALVQFVLGRARTVGAVDPKLGLDWLRILESEKDYFRSPMQEVRRLVHLAEQTQIEQEVKATREVFTLLSTASDKFGISVEKGVFDLFSVEEDRVETFSKAALNDPILSTIGPEFEAFVRCFDFLNRDELIVRKIKKMVSEVRGWSSAEEAVVHSMIDGNDDSSNSPVTKRRRGLLNDFSVIKQYIEKIVSVEKKSEALYLVLLFFQSGRGDDTLSGEIEAIGAEVVGVENDENEGEYFYMLKSYLSVLCCQKALVRYSRSDFAYLVERPDFLMSTDNVRRIVAVLCTDEDSGDLFLPTLSVLVKTFCYLDFEECVVLRLLTRVMEGVDGVESMRERIRAGCSSGELDLSVSMSSIMNKFVLALLDIQGDQERVHRILQKILPQVTCSSTVRLWQQISCLQSEWGVRECTVELARDLENVDLEYFLRTIEAKPPIDEAKVMRATLLFNLENDEGRSGDHLHSLLDRWTVLKNNAHHTKAELESLCYDDGLFEKILKNIGADTSIDVLTLVEGVIGPSYTMLAEAERPIVDSNTLRVLRWDMEWSAVGGYGSVPDPIVNLCRMLVGDWRAGDASTDLSEMESYFKLVDLAKLELSDFVELRTVEVRTDPPDLSLIENHQATMSSSKRTAVLCHWGVQLENLGVPFDRSVLLACVSDKEAVKHCLKTMLPKLIVKSGFDLEVAQNFCLAIRKENFREELLVQFLEIAVTGNSMERAVQICRAPLVELATSSSGIEKICKYLVPLLVGRSVELAELKKLQFLLVTVTNVSTNASPESAHAILTLRQVVDKIVLLNAKISLASLLENPRECLVAAAVECLADVDCVGSLVSVAESLNCKKKVLMQVLETWVSRAGKEMLSGIDGILWILSELGKTESNTEELLKQIVETVKRRELLGSPSVSAGSVETFFRLVQYANSVLGHQDADFRAASALRVLTKAEVPVSAKHLHVLLNGNGDAVKSFIEELTQNWNVDGCIVAEIAKLFFVDFARLKIDLIKKAIVEDLDDQELIEKIQHVVRLNLVNASADEKDKLATCLLKLFFAPEYSARTKTVCFRVLFNSFDISTITGLYKQGMDNLLQIGKNLMYLDLLERNKIIKKQTPYKEFHSLDKCLIVKRLCTSFNLEFLRIASFLICDFEIFDYELVACVETQLKSVGGPDAMVVLNQFKHRMVQSGLYAKVVKEEDGGDLDAPCNKILTQLLAPVTDENASPQNIVYN